MCYLFIQSDKQIQIYIQPHFHKKYEIKLADPQLKNTALYDSSFVNIVLQLHDPANTLNKF